MSISLRFMYRTQRRTQGEGLFPTISSIFSRTAGVSLGMTSSALRLSKTCSGLDAPRMTVEVFGFRATHASARCDTLQLSSRHQNDHQEKRNRWEHQRDINEPFSAKSDNCRMVAICFWPSGELRNSTFFLNWASFWTSRREPSGTTPSLYWKKITSV